MSNHEHIPADADHPSHSDKHERDLPRYHLLVEVAADVEFSAISALASEADRAGWSALLIDSADDNITLLAGIAPLTRHIGLVAGIDPLVVAPYTAARRLASLDHISNGRAGWRLLGDASPAIQADFTAAVRALWDSWSEHAHLIDKENGRYIDLAAVKPANYRGPYFRTAGPLDIPRPVQGHPVQYGSLVETLPDVLLVSDIDTPAPTYHPVRTARQCDAEAWQREQTASPRESTGQDVIVSLPLNSATAGRLHLPAAERPDDSAAPHRLRDRLGVALPATGALKEFLS